MLIGVPLRTTEGAVIVYQFLKLRVYVTSTQAELDSPIPQVTQDASPAVENVPVGHAVHAVDPAVEYVFLAQVIQEVADVAPLVEEYLPA